jgi:hypothetical protein
MGDFEERKERTLGMTMTSNCWGRLTSCMEVLSTLWEEKVRIYRREKDETLRALRLLQHQGGER